MRTERTYKASYKTYLNDRLKPVMFHGKETFPVYIQVTFDRRPIYFKSYYFDLLLKPQFVARHFTGNRYPTIKDVEEKEKQLIDFLMDKYADDFTLELFKEKYLHYCRDLLNMMEEDFKDYLYVFFNDEGDNLLASMVQRVGEYESAQNIVDGLRRPLKPGLFQKLMDNAAHAAPPYLPLMELAAKKGKQGPITFSVFEWESEDNQVALREMITKSNGGYEWKQVKNHIENLISKKRKSV